MGTIVARKRSDGSTGYTAQILRKKKGTIILREAKTFDRRQAAVAWLKRRETELSEHGAIERANSPAVSLSTAIDRYIDESRKVIGRTKAQVLKSIKEYDLANMDCPEIKSENIVDFAKELAKGERQPQTVGNYLSHLASIFAIAKPAWGYQLDPSAMADAQVVLRRLGIISKSKHRNRRPTLPEHDLLMQHFFDRSKRRPKAALMHFVIAYAIFSTRRQEEITRQEMSDVDSKHSRLLVRDMKHPGEKIGNDTWCVLPTPALKIINAMKNSGRVFPYSTDAIGAAFTRACKFLDISDLRFHDLRHDGVSYLFETGKTIPQAVSISGHKSWQSLQRYRHLRQTGDKYAGWKWLDVVTAH
ncbi:MAG TPA: tyrosine-type recombinase/integrase [Bradyrhizobium sp.]|jgi:integrase|nr:tyrosine-type recombinase/integrase [Bradyrhizobium sp.]